MRPGQFRWPRAGDRPAARIARSWPGRAKVLISGEPGIGKSRMAAALSARIASEPHTWDRANQPAPHGKRCLAHAKHTRLRCKNYRHRWPDGALAKTCRYHGALGGQGKLRALQKREERKRARHARRLAMLAALYDAGK